MGDLKVDIRELKKLQAKLHALESQSGKREKFCEDCAKELAARLLSLVIKRTPVGKYPKGSGQVGGTLRRGWTAGEKTGAKAFVDGCKVYKNGNIYTIVVKNAVEYAPYVEYGHRTRGGGWVAGQFFLTLSEKDLEAMAPGVLEKKLNAFLQEVFA